MSDIFDAATMQKVIELVNRLYQNIDRVGQSVEDIVGTARGGAKAVASEFRDAKTATTGLNAELRETNQRMVDLHQEATGKGIHKLDAFFTEADRRLQSVAKDADNSVMGRLLFGSQGINALSGRIGGVMGSVQNLVAGARSQIFAGMPTAGWLGVLLMGASSEMEFAAKAHRAINGFSDIMDGSLDDLHKVRAVMEDLDKNKIGFMSSDDLMASQAAFARAGLGLREVSSTYTSVFDNVERRVDVFAARMDKTFNMQDGTAAKAMTDWAASTGRTLPAAARWFEDIAVAARRTGTSVSGLLGVMTATSGALRYQSGEARGLLSVYTQLSGVNSRLGLGGAAGNAASLSTLGNIGSLAGNLPQNYAAYYGNRIARTQEGGGFRGSGLEGYYLMSRGFRSDRKPEGIDTGFAILQNQLSDVAGAIKLRGGNDYEGLGRRQVMLEGMGYSRQDAGVLAELSKKLDQLGKFNAASLTDEQRKTIADVEARRLAAEEPVQLILKQLNAIITQVGVAQLRALLTLVAGMGVLVSGLSNGSFAGASDILTPHIQGTINAGKGIGEGLKALGVKGGIAVEGLSDLKYQLPSRGDEIIDRASQFATRARLVTNPGAIPGEVLTTMLMDAITVPGPDGKRSLRFGLQFIGYGPGNAVEPASAGG